MAARKTRNRSNETANRRFRLMRPYLDEAAFPRQKNGNFTASARKRIAALWDELAPIVGEGREARPYRFRKVENAREVEKQLGIRVTRKKGVRALPIAVDRSTDRVRVRFRKTGIAIEKVTRRGRRETRSLLTINPVALATDARGHVASLTARFPRRARYRLRLGKGFRGGPGLVFDRESLLDEVEELSARYNVSEFLTSIEAIVS